jgi:hypothetical protein
MKKIILLAFSGVFLSLSAVDIKSVGLDTNNYKENINMELEYDPSKKIYNLHGSSAGLQFYENDKLEFDSKGAAVVVDAQLSEKTVSDLVIGNNIQNLNLYYNKEYLASSSIHYDIKSYDNFDHTQFGIFVGGVFYYGFSNIEHNSETISLKYDKETFSVGIKEPLRKYLDKKKNVNTLYIFVAVDNDKWGVRSYPFVDFNWNTYSNYSYTKPGFSYSRNKIQTSGMTTGYHLGVDYKISDSLILKSSFDYTDNYEKGDTSYIDNLTMFNVTETSYFFKAGLHYTY